MFIFKEITAADDPAIARIVRDNLERVGLNIPGTAYFDEALDHLSSVYGRADSKYYVMLDQEGTVVGGIGFARFDPLPETAELQKLYLADEVKGAGLGYEMISFIEDRMRDAGYSFSYLETHDALEAALYIYRKDGYQEIERPKEVVHSTMTRFFLKKL